MNTMQTALRGLPMKKYRPTHWSRAFIIFFCIQASPSNATIHLNSLAPLEIAELKCEQSNDDLACTGNIFHTRPRENTQDTLEIIEIYSYSLNYEKLILYSSTSLNKEGKEHPSLNVSPAPLSFTIANSKQYSSERRICIRVIMRNIHGTKSLGYQESFLLTDDKIQLTKEVASGDVSCMN